MSSKIVFLVATCLTIFVNASHLAHAESPQSSAFDSCESFIPREYPKNGKIDFKALEMALISNPNFKDKRLDIEIGLLKRANPEVRYRHTKGEIEIELSQNWSNHVLIQQVDAAQAFDNLKAIYDTPGPGLGTPYKFYKYLKLPIHFIAFESPETEGLAFDRLALFVEVEPGRIRPDTHEDRKLTLDYKQWELGEAGSDGNDYDLVDVANFFNAAMQQRIALNVLECRMRSELVARGLLKYADLKYISSPGAIISTGRRSVSAIDHEFNHGIWFTDPEYRSASVELWSSLPLHEKELAKLIMKSFFEYALDQDENLGIREFLAWFRDSDELLKSYLNPVGEALEIGDHKYEKIKHLYDDKGFVRPEILEKIMRLSQRVRSIDDRTKAYD